MKIGHCLLRGIMMCLERLTHLTLHGAFEDRRSAEVPLRTDSVLEGRCPLEFVTVMPPESGGPRAVRMRIRRAVESAVKALTKALTERILVPPLLWINPL
jgi:hypothetical protein